jgi:hypothetical protein
MFRRYQRRTAIAKEQPWSFSNSVAVVKAAVSEGNAFIRQDLHKMVLERRRRDGFAYREDGVLLAGSARFQPRQRRGAVKNRHSGRGLNSGKRQPGIKASSEDKPGVRGSWSDMVSVLRRNLKTEQFEGRRRNGWSLVNRAYQKIDSRSSFAKVVRTFRGVAPYLTHVELAILANGSAQAQWSFLRRRRAYQGSSLVDGSVPPNADDHVFVGQLASMGVRATPQETALAPSHVSTERSGKSNDEIPKFVTWILEWLPKSIFGEVHGSVLGDPGAVWRPRRDERFMRFKSKW